MEALKSLLKSLPAIEQSDLQGFEEGIRRVAMWYSLLSFLPVLVEGKMRESRLYVQRAQVKQVRPEGDEEEKEPEVSLPLGFTSTVLFLASEALGARAVLGFGQQAGKGPLISILKGFRRGQKIKSSGALAMLAAGATEALDSKAAFRAAHGLAMLVALSSVLASSCLFRLRTWWSASKKKTVHLSPSTLAAVLAALGLFVATNQSILNKVLKMTTGSDTFMSSLQLSLRILALLTADLPKVRAEEGGTPVIWGAFQASSLVASICAEIASGDLHKAVVPLRSLSFDSLLDSRFTRFLAPTILGLLWLGAGHLTRNGAAAILVCLLTIFTSPIFLVQTWPKVAFSLGYGHTLNAAASGLAKLVSVLYATTGSLLVLSGGPIGVLVLVGLAQLLTRIYGADAVNAAIS